MYTTLDKTKSIQSFKINNRNWKDRLNHLLAKLNNPQHGI